MGFFDKVKKATGVGLTPEQHYARVYEKAILLGEENYEKGIALFKKAAEQAAKAEMAELENRALANAAFYSFITSGDASHLPTMLQHLGKMEEIEEIGSQSDMRETGPLVAEIQARMIEAGAMKAGGSSTAKAEAHRAAANGWKKLGMADLFTYNYTSPDQHKSTAMERFMYHLGKASWHDAVATVEATPEGAAEHMAKAMNYFKQCNDESWSGKAENWLRKCRVKRTCWMCGREFQGEDLHFSTYPSDLAPYILSVVQALGQDTHTLNLGADRLVLCRACGTTIDKLADKWATQRSNELRVEVKDALKQIDAALSGLRSDVRTLDNRLRSVERAAHHH